MIGACEHVLGVLNGVEARFARDLTSFVAHSSMILTVAEISVTNVPVLALSILTIAVYIFEVVHG